MRPPLPVTLTLLLAVLSGLALAQPPVQVLSPWVRATVPGQTATGAFMTLSASQDTRLVAVRSPRAGTTAEIHQMTLSGDVMRMREIPGIDLPAGQGVALAPGGYHIMLYGLRAPLRAGDVEPLELVFRNRAGERRTLRVKVPVRSDP